jgi:crotonobetainyl-CoA:carnitine CoA-transferase CaiB-like acyl-CoA transferase
MRVSDNDEFGEEQNMTASAKALQGIRVLDFSTTIAGPHCTRMLSDMGADVIKIETDEGETMRTRPPVRGNCSTVFGGYNVGKKSVVLDLKSGKGVEAVKRLVAKVDVLVENFRPGVMRRLKLDHETLRGLNPKLIYCSISGYGQTGPSAELPAYAPVIHAASGYDMAHLAYQPGRERPDYCGIYHADILTGVYAYGAIASALVQRPQTGQGQHIDVSMLESMLSLTQNEVQGVQFPIKPPQRPMFGPMETADGYVMVAIAGIHPRFAICGLQRPPRSLGRPDGRRRDLVAHVDLAAMPCRAQQGRSSQFRVSQRRGSHGRSANRAPWRADGSDGR